MRRQSRPRQPDARADPTDPAVGVLVRRLRVAGCVFAEEEAAVLLEAARDARTLGRMTIRRVAGEPLEHVVGHVDLAGTRLCAGAGVFVPRQRSTLLVTLTVQAVDRAAERRVDQPADTCRRPILVEACCGVAPVANLVALRLPGCEVHAADVCPRARRLARSNLPPGAEVHGGHLLDGLPPRLRGQVDVVAAIPPYVPDAAMRLLSREAREHEPERALIGGADGLDFVRDLLWSTVEWLAPEGRLLVEVAADQIDDVVAHADNRRHRGGPRARRHRGRGRADVADLGRGRRGWASWR